ncbi:hypothetical protein [Roseibacillus ishigakijimensis]|uniref:Uncharacterized protein n=1 Tax=Roseibacillus ishigakijimensis TaxID=454146 RepID=A0A934VKG6_9BACT|nr:hypothetical protein [Roseibacillus ishigakijimensis]MBK1833629.1 hypothetical protein [Roseibacillus ishigakijimensis]
MKTLLFFLLCGYAFLSTVSAERAQLSETGVSVELPADFKTNGVVEAYLHHSQSLLGGLAIEGGFEEVYAARFAPTAPRVGITERISAEVVKMGEWEGRLLLESSELLGLHTEVWRWVFGNEEETRLVYGSYPADRRKEMSEVLREAVLSASWQGRKAVTAASQKRLGTPPPFTVTESEFLKRVPVPFELVVLTKDGGMPDPAAPGNPFVSISQRQEPEWQAPGDWVGLSQRTLARRDDLTLAAVPEARAVLVGGQAVVVLDALANRAGTDLYHQQALIPAADGYYHFSATVAAADRDPWQQRFEEVLKTFQTLPVESDD